MKIWPSVRTTLAFFFRRSEAEREMEEEIRSHLRSRADDLEGQGLPRAEAERQARIEFGGYQRYKEECRDALSTRVLGELVADVRFGLRQLRRNPGFTTVAVLTLALGIGASTAIFSFIDAVVVRTAPYPRSNELVAIYQRRGEVPGGYIQTGVSALNFLDICRESNVFQELGYYHWARPFLTGAGSTEHLLGAAISPNLLKLLGVRPFLGRAFGSQEAEPGHSRLALLGYGLWQRQFGGRPEVIAQTLRFDGIPYTVVGVMPKSFYFVWDDAIDVLGPLPLTPKDLAESQRSKRTLNVLGRLKPGVTLKEAQADMDTIAARLATEYPDANKGWGLRVRSLHSTYYRASVPEALVAIVVAAFSILLIACVNFANLLLVRSTARQREIAVRGALGASRRQLFVQLITESLLLALLGGLVGILFSWGSLRLLAFGAQSYPLPGRQWIGLSGTALAFCLILAAITGVIFGLVPAFHASKVDLNESLKESAAASSAGASGRRTRDGLVVCEVALAMILLAGGALLLRTFINLQNADVGFDPSHVLTFDAALPTYEYKTGAQESAFLSEVLGRLRSLPGARDASGFVPGGRLGFRPEGQALGLPAQAPTASVYAILPGLVRTLRATLISGREFTAADDEETAPPVAIINETLAHAYFPNVDPLGRRLIPVSKVYSPRSRTAERPIEIVGVVKDIETMGVRDNAARLYVPYAQYPPQHFMTFVLRTAAPPMSLVPAVRATVASADSGVAVGYFAPLKESIGDWEKVRFPMVAVGVFAVLALLVSAVGIFGVVSYSASQRTHEIGIRMALGAQKGDVLRLVLPQGIILALIGVGIGIVGALGLTRFLSSLLYGVKPTDPLTFAAVVLILFGVALLACYIPARRATKIDPMEALRHE